MDISFTGVIVTGLLRFLSPCILPIVPFYLCYMAGVSMSDLQGQDEIPDRTHLRLIFASIAFALGVTTIFALLGLGATALGQVFRMWQQELSYVAAAFSFAFDLHFLGLIRKPWLNQVARVELPPRNSGKTALGQDVFAPFQDPK